MKEVRYEFLELESNTAFEQLAKTFNGTVQSGAIYFDNPVAKGELIKKDAEVGLWVRKWKLTVFQKITLHQRPSPEGLEKRFSLIYFLNPSIFDIRRQWKRVPVNKSCNTLFLSNRMGTDFSVLPKQPFYALDITFTAAWLQEQFKDAGAAIKKVVHSYGEDGPETVLSASCNADDYKILQELEEWMQEKGTDSLFLRSRIYELICSFFEKVCHKTGTHAKQSSFHYEQVVQAEAMMMQDLQKPPTVEAVAKSVNMSTSSLARQFKLMYGKSVHEYYVEKKMELARRMLVEEKISVKKAAEILGYKQASPFIETFTRQFGYSPGTLKVQ